MVQLASICIMSLTLIACGGPDTSPAPLSRTGVFVDTNVVEGLGYETFTMSGESSQSGKTNAQGQFDFNAGERVTFRLGGLALPQIQAANTVTPSAIFANNEAAAADLSRLLQSMDEDGNNENGIKLPSAAVEGLGYATVTMSGESSISGKTDMDGQFNFNVGERITFSLGGLALPQTQAASTVTPITIFGSDEAAVADLSRLLQSMDEDGNNENGIKLPLSQ